VKVTSEQASIWSNPLLAKILLAMIRAASFLLRIELVHDFQGLAPSRAAFVIPRAFYRPFIRVRSFCLWGTKLLRVREDPVDELSSRIWPSSNLTNDLMPVGLFLSRQIPETEFTISPLRKDELKFAPRMVSIGKEGAPLLGISEPTKSYFHFVTELLPLVLQYSEEWKVVVPVFSDWQMDVISAFSFEEPVELTHEDISIKTVLKRSMWGVYPASAPLLRANQHLLSLKDVASLWTGGNELFLLRTDRSSTTGRLPAPNIISFFESRPTASVIEPASMPVVEQFSAVRNARLVVGTHGSAFASLVASEPGTQVVEIDGPDIFHFHIERLCKILCLDYVLVAANLRNSRLQVETAVLEQIVALTDIR